jgi:DNA polymerase III delta prime subunit
MLHAWLVTGPAGAERRAESRRLAAELIAAGAEGPLVLAGHHPDVREYPDPLRIDDVREIAATLARPPLLGGGRALLLGGLAQAKAEAQNALLRMMEEPPPDLYFVAEAETAQQVLPTLRSRLGMHPLPRLAPSAIAERLRASRPDASGDLIDEVSHGADGYVDKALALLDALSALDAALPPDDGREDWFIRAASAVDASSETCTNGLAGRFAARWHGTWDPRYLRAWQHAEETRLIIARNGNARLAAEVLFSELARLGVLRGGASSGDKVP